MKIKLTNMLLGFGALLIAFQVNAATVALTPSQLTVDLNTTFNLDVGGTGFTNGATSGSVVLTWDQNFLEIANVVLASGLQADGTGTGGTFEWQTITPGTLAPGSFDLSAFFTDTNVFGGGSTFPATGAAFDFLTITFNAINSTLNPADVMILAGSGGNWQDANNNAILGVQYGSAMVTVNPVPVPASVWLLGSGILGLVGMGRSRKVTLA